MSLLPKTLNETESPISGKIKVIQVGPERRLIVGGLVQSINFDAPEVDERIWGQLTNIKDQKAKIKNALILGLGGGTVAHLLTQKLGAIPIDGVEIDPVIVDVARKYFDIGKIKNLNVVIGDVVDVVSHPTNYSLRAKNYDLIIVDIYLREEFPKKAGEESFLKDLNNLLSKEGLIAINKIQNHNEGKFEESLRKVFTVSEVKTVPSKSGGENVVYLAAKRSRVQAQEWRPPPTFIGVRSSFRLRFIRLMGASEYSRRRK